MPLQNPIWKTILRRIGLSLLLLFFITFLIAMLSEDTSVWSYGWPFPFLHVNEITPIPFLKAVKPLGFILNIIFWYYNIYFVTVLLEHLRSESKKNCIKH